MVARSVANPSGNLNGLRDAIPGSRFARPRATALNAHRPTRFARLPTLLTLLVLPPDGQRATGDGQRPTDFDTPNRTTYYYRR